MHRILQKNRLSDSFATKPSVIKTMTDSEILLFMTMQANLITFFLKFSCFLLVVKTLVKLAMAFGSIKSRECVLKLQISFICAPDLAILLRN